MASFASLKVEVYDTKKGYRVLIIAKSGTYLAPYSGEADSVLGALEVAAAKIRDAKKSRLGRPSHRYLVAQDLRAKKSN